MRTKKTQFILGCLYPIANFIKWLELMRLPKEYFDIENCKDWFFYNLTFTIYCENCFDYHNGYWVFTFDDNQEEIEIFAKNPITLIFKMIEYWVWLNRENEWENHY